jgi:hypothetical protein
MVASGDGTVVSERLESYPLILILGEMNMIQSTTSKCKTCRVDRVQVGEDLHKYLRRKKRKGGMVSCHGKLRIACKMDSQEGIKERARDSILSEHLFT